MMQYDEDDRKFKEFVKRTRDGDFSNWPRLQELLPQPRPISNSGQVVPDPQKRLRELSKIIVRSSGLAFPHLRRAEILQQTLTAFQAANPSFAGMSAEDRAVQIFQGLSPLIAMTSTWLLVKSLHVAILVTAIGLLLAAIRKTSNGTRNWLRLDCNHWDLIAIFYSFLTTALGIFVSGIINEIVLLLGLCTIISLLTVYFNGGRGLEGISLLWFLVRNWRLRVSIAAENLAIWLPHRLYQVETALQEYINLANETFPRPAVGPFSSATRTVLTLWIGYDPFPVVAPAENPPPQEPESDPVSSTPPRSSPPSQEYAPARDPTSEVRSDGNSSSQSLFPENSDRTEDSEDELAEYYQNMRAKKLRDDEGRVS